MRKWNKNNISGGLAEAPGRRRFLRWLWIGVGGIAVFEFVLVCISFFKPVKKDAERLHPENNIDAGNIETFKPGTVTAFVRGQFYLVRLEDGGFLALSGKCTHLGCSVPWNEENKQFICPCHASKFDITGAVVSSPAPRALDKFWVEIINQNVHVDLGRPIRRKGFTKDQPVYPESIKFKSEAG